MDGEHQSAPIRPMRALLQRLAAPLTGLEQLMQEADTLLAPWTPPLTELVEFTPFALLSVSEPAMPPPSPVQRRPGGLVTPATSTALPPVAADPPSAGKLAELSPAFTAGEYPSVVQPVPPVFSLAARQHNATVPSPTADLRLEQEHETSGPALASSVHLVTPRVAPAQGEPVVEEHGVQRPAHATLPASWAQSPTGFVAAGLDADPAPWAAMSLLTTLTSTLLDPPPPAATSMATAPLGTSVPTVADQALPPRVDSLRSLAGLPPTADAIPALETPLPTDVLVTTLAMNDASAHAAVGVDSPPDELLGRWTAPTTAPGAPPDAWTLAQLINQVLSAEARRQGVDLS